MIDTHAHMDMNPFDADRAYVIERALSSGVDRIVTVGIDTESSSRAVGLAGEFTGMYATVGFHPHNARNFTKELADSLAEMASLPEVVAWGEIGLDFFRDNSPRDTQRKAFLSQLEYAMDLEIPVVIHSRDAHGEILAALKRLGKREGGGVIHCYSGSPELAWEFIALGYSISIPGTITYSKAADVRETAASIPLESLLVETDAPYLAPVPHRGKRNEPAFVSHTVKAIAGLRGVEFDEIAGATTANAEALFRLPPE